MNPGTPSCLWAEVTRAYNPYCLLTGTAIVDIFLYKIKDMLKKIFLLINLFIYLPYLFIYIFTNLFFIYCFFILFFIKAVFHPVILQVSYSGISWEYYKQLIALVHVDDELSSVRLK